MRSKLFFAFLALSACRQACGLDQASTGGSAGAPAGGAGGAGGQPQGGAPTGGSPVGTSTNGGGGNAETSMATGGGGGLPAPVLCADFDGPGVGGAMPECGGKVLIDVSCASASATLQFDCEMAGGCQSEVGVPDGGTVTVNSGVLQMTPVDSGFFDGQDAMFVYWPHIDESFLAVTLVQPLDATTGDWPDEVANLAGLVVRDGLCDNGSGCGRWTKFEVGITPSTAAGWVLASSTDGVPNNAPMPFASGTFSPPVGLDDCPPPILVGLCGVRNGAQLTLAGSYATLADGFVGDTMTAHSWTPMTSPFGLDVGIVAAAGYGLADNDLRARFGLFAIYGGISGAADCAVLFNEVRTRILNQPL